MDFEIEVANEVATAAVGWYANRLNGAQLAESIEATFKRFGHPEQLLYPTLTFNAGERQASELCALLAWEMNDTGRAMHDTVLSLVERAGLGYSEVPPGTCLLRFDSVAKYETLERLLEDEMLEDSWPSDFSVSNVGPFRWVTQ